MAYVIKYSDGKRNRSFSTTSFYEYTTKKNELRRANIKCTTTLTGEEEKTDKTKKSLDAWSRIVTRADRGDMSVVKDFIRVCDKVGVDFRNKKRSAKNARKARIGK